MLDFLKETLKFQFFFLNVRKSKHQRNLNLHKLTRSKLIHVKNTFNSTRLQSPFITMSLSDEQAANALLLLQFMNPMLSH